MRQIKWHHPCKPTLSLFRPLICWFWFVFDDFYMVLVHMTGKSDENHIMWDVWSNSCAHSSRHQCVTTSANRNHPKSIFQLRQIWKTTMGHPCTKHSAIPNSGPRPTKAKNSHANKKWTQSEQQARAWKHVNAGVVLTRQILYMARPWVLPTYNTFLVIQPLMSDRITTDRRYAQ